MCVLVKDLEVVVTASSHIPRTGHCQVLVLWFEQGRGVGRLGEVGFPLLERGRVSLVRLDVCWRERKIQWGNAGASGCLEGGRGREGCCVVVGCFLNKVEEEGKGVKAVEVMSGGKLSRLMDVADGVNVFLDEVLFFYEEVCVCALCVCSVFREDRRTVISFFFP